MLNRKITILLAGIMCFSPVSGLFSVICRGSDGHIAVEPVFHSHCNCPQMPASEHNHAPAGGTIGSSANHDHCKDFTAFSSVIAAAGKTVKPSTPKVLSSASFLNPVSVQNAPSLRGFAAQSDELSPFFTPLLTVILLS